MPSRGAWIACVLIAGAATAAEPGSVEALLAAPPRSAPDLSPDGSHYVFVSSDETAERVMIAAVVGGPAREIARFDDPDRRILWADWVKPNRVLVSLHERAIARGLAVRPRRTRLFSVTPDGGPPREYIRRTETCEVADAAPGGRPRVTGDFLRCSEAALQVQDEVLHAMPTHPDEVLVVYRDPEPEVRRLNLATGRSILHESAQDHAVGFAADSAGRVLAVAKRTGRRFWLRARATPDAPWQTVIESDAGEPGAPSFAAFSDEDSALLVTAGHEGRAALFRVDIATGARTLVAASPRASVTAVRLSGPAGKLAAVYFDDETVRFPDPVAASEQARIDAALPHARNDVWAESDLGHRVLLVASLGASGLRRYLAFDRQSGALTPLYAERDVAEDSLAPTRRVGPSPELAWRAALTLPRAAAQAVAAVVIVRCGPTPADLFGYDAEAQALARRGIASLEIDVGAGAPAAESAAEWTERVQGAVATSATWLVERGVADSKRIGVYGTGFGGWAALAVAAREPARFRAVAALSPVVWLSSFVRESRQFDGRSWPGWLRPRSAARRAATLPAPVLTSITAPVLLVHGEEAVFASPVQSRALAKRLRRAGRDVTHLELAREIDVPERPSSRARAYGAWLAFFERTLAQPAQ